MATNQAQHDLEVIFSNTQIPMAYMDRDFNFLRVNLAYAKADKKMPEDFPGKNHFELYPNEENQRIFQSVVDSGKAHYAVAKPFEYKHNPERGVSHWDWSLLPIPDGQGSQAGVLLQLLDVTEHVNTESKLRYQHRVSEAFIDSVGALAVILDKQGRIERFNRACEQVTGYRSEEVIGQYVWDVLLSPVQIESVKSVFNNLASTTEPSQFENFWIAKDGSRKLIRWSNTVIAGDDGHAEHIIGVGTDITEQLEAQKALQRSEDAFRKAQELVRMGTWDWDLEENTLHWSDEIYRIFNVPPEQFANSYAAFENFIHPEDREKVNAAVQACLNEPDSTYDVEHRIVVPDRSVRFVHEQGRVYVDSHGKPVRMVGLVQDVTEQKLMQEQLTAQELRLKQLTDTITQVFWMISPDGSKTEYVSPAFETIWGRKCSELYAEPKLWMKAIHDDDRDRVAAAFASKISREEFDEEYRVVRPDGSIRWIRDRAYPIRNDAGVICYVAGVAEDITEHHRAMQQVRQQARVIDQIHDSVVSTDLDGFITSWNKGAERIFGYSAEEMLGEHIANVYPEEEHAFLRDEIIAPLKQKGTHETEVRMLRKSGELFYANLSLSLLTDDTGVTVGMIGYTMDISDRKIAEKELEKYQHQLEELVNERTAKLQATQDELLKQERLATLGKLTATVSHELRNPLGAISTALHLLQKYIDADNPKANSALDRIVRNVKRCDHIIDELLDYARSRELEEEEVLLDQWMKGLIDEQEIPPEVSLDFNPKLDGVHLKIDPHRMRRAVVNILENALHALREPGSDKISVGSELCVSTSLAGNEYRIVIKDNGSGIATDTLEKIFEPLFSTKGFGVGLGMSTVKQIMEQHGGGIRVDSCPGVGTSITLWLPQSRDVAI